MKKQINTIAKINELLFFSCLCPFPVFISVVVMITGRVSLTVMQILYVGFAARGIAFMFLFFSVCTLYDLYVKITKIFTNNQKKTYINYIKHSFFPYLLFFNITILPFIYIISINNGYNWIVLFVIFCIVICLVSQIFFNVNYLKLLKSESVTRQYLE
ncbi:MAG TPA: hypothetical protein P5123_12470 [Spirochaetota bacterium]|nr:hypothetical protein [Spirochaetota bacterium]